MSQIVNSDTLHPGGIRTLYNPLLEQSAGILEKAALRLDIIQGGNIGANKALELRGQK